MHHGNTRGTFLFFYQTITLQQGFSFSLLLNEIKIDIYYGCSKTSTPSFVLKM
jgi:hypothetical protein